MLRSSIINFAHSSIFCFGIRELHVSYNSMALILLRGSHRQDKRVFGFDFLRLFSANEQTVVTTIELQQIESTRHKTTNKQNESSKLFNGFSTKIR